MAFPGSGKSLLLALPWGLIAAGYLATPPKLYVIGDSTAAAYAAEKSPLTGWAQVLQNFCVAESVQVVDDALSGRSSKSFRAEGHWTPIQAALRPGDVVFIQFGHNDEKTDDTTRGTIPGTTFKQQLSLYVDEALAKGATPILLTPIERNAWNADNTALTPTHITADGDYPQAIRELAAARKIGLIDVTDLTKRYLEKIGKDSATGLFMNLPAGKWPNYPNGSTDNTHLQQKGASAFAQLVAEDLARQRIPRISAWVKASTTGLLAWTPSELSPAFCAGTADSRSPDSLLRVFQSQYSTRAGWEARAGLVRTGMQKKMKLFPWPAKTPLKAVTHGKRILPGMGITVENVFFESYPGFFVTGNLYRPIAVSARPAGILRVHGHGVAPRFADDFQRHCAAMASMGAIVFGYDMVGKGESNQVPHCFPDGIMAMQTWNTMRGVDFLLSLGADSARIGITGESGGGTQSYIAAALDPRISLSMPGVIVGGTSAGVWMGGCNCEATGMGIHEDTDPKNDIADYKTNPIDIAAMAAPRFQLILSDKNDPLAPDAPTTTLPYLRNVYKLYGAEGNVANFHDTTGHNYHFNKRMASYRFLVDKFKLGPALPDEGKYAPVPAESLLCYTPQFPRPPYALKTPAEILAGLFQPTTAMIPFRKSPVSETAIRLRGHDVAGRCLPPTVRP